MICRFWSTISFRAATLGFCAVMMLGCDQSFNPKGTYSNTFAVYSVLSTASDTALVRVFRTYDPPGFDPYAWTTDPSITDATVSLFKEDTAYAVRDTFITRTDKSRYQTDVKGYVAQPFPVEFGKHYSVLVTSLTAGSLSASATVPTKANMSIVNPYVLDFPGQYSQERVQIQIRLSSLTRGYLLRGFLEYDLLEGVQWITHRQEVPNGWGGRSPDGGTLLYPQFPTLKRRESRETSDGIENSYANSFPPQAFTITASELRSKYGSPNLRINRAVFILNQVEPNFYSYYNVVNAFRDKNSIRLDEPGYTNIQGGEGVFGAFTVEEISHDLPANVY